MQKLALILAAFITSMMMMGQEGLVNKVQGKGVSIATSTISIMSISYGEKIPHNEYKTITSDVQQHLDTLLECPRNRGFPIKNYE